MKGIHHVCEKWIVVVVVAADVRANVSECVLACVCVGRQIHICDKMADSNSSHTLIFPFAKGKQ